MILKSDSSIVGRKSKFVGKSTLKGIMLEVDREFERTTFVGRTFEVRTLYNVHKVCLIDTYIRPIALILENKERTIK